MKAEWPKDHFMVHHGHTTARGRTSSTEGERPCEWDNHRCLWRRGRGISVNEGDRWLTSLEWAGEPGKKIWFLRHKKSHAADESFEKDSPGRHLSTILKTLFKKKYVMFEREKCSSYIPVCCPPAAGEGPNGFGPAQTSHKERDLLRSSNQVAHLGSAPLNPTSNQMKLGHAWLRFNTDSKEFTWGQKATWVPTARRMGEEMEIRGSRLICRRVYLQKFRIFCFLFFRCFRNCENGKRPFGLVYSKWRGIEVKFQHHLWQTNLTPN